MERAPGRRPRPGWLADAERLDLAIYAAIARTDTPSLDPAMRRLSRAADRSRLNLATAAAIALGGGRVGRRAAVTGVASIGAASVVVNALAKPLARRRRPDRALHEVPGARHVDMPRSRSLPSGHSASAFAFATGAGHELPYAGIALRLGAATVAYSRVHTGVHYPGDVVLGALLGTAVGQSTAYVLDRRR